MIPAVARPLTGRDGLVRRVVDRVAGSTVAVAGPAVTHSPLSVLTFDDGPEPGSTDRVLEVLARHGVTATFFVLTGRVRREPALFAEVVAAGHEIGLHGVDHRRLTDLPLREVRERTRAGQHELADRLGAPVRWFRAPYGALSPAGVLAVRSLGMEPVRWGASLDDWLDGPTVHQRVTAALGTMTPGSVLLAHDGHAGTEDGVDDGPAPRLDRAALQDGLLRAVTGRGWRVSSLGAAVATGAAEPVRRARLRR